MGKFLHMSDVFLIEAEIEEAYTCLLFFYLFLALLVFAAFFHPTEELFRTLLR